jgi:hypothetical protein
LKIIAPLSVLALLSVASAALASALLHVYYGRTRLDDPEEALTIREVRLLG